MNAHAYALRSTQSLMERVRYAEGRVVALEAENAALRACVAKREHLFSDASTMQAILMACAEYFGIPVADITSSSRARDRVVARQIAAFLARDMTPLSTPVIGKFLGGRDHTTILHSVDMARRKMENDFEFSKDVRYIRGMVLSRKLPEAAA